MVPAPTFIPRPCPACRVYVDDFNDLPARVTSKSSGRGDVEVSPEPVTDGGRERNPFGGVTASADRPQPLRQRSVSPLASPTGLSKPPHEVSQC